MALTGGSEADGLAALEVRSSASARYTCLAICAHAYDVGIARFPQHEVERLRNALLHLENSNDELRAAIAEQGPDKARLALRLPRPWPITFREPDLIWNFTRTATDCACT